MALLEIPVQPNGVESRITTTFTLESRQWTLRFYTNSVDDAWYWDLINDASDAVILGEGLVLGVSMLERFRALDIPAGELFVVEQGEGLGGRDPDQEAFADGRAALYYLESA